MSSFKRTESLDFGKRNDILFVKSTALLATLIVTNYVVCLNFIY